VWAYENLRDLIDLDLGEGLAMSERSSIPNFVVELYAGYFFASSVFDDRARYFARCDRRSNIDVIATNQEHFIKRNALARVERQFFNGHGFTRFDQILFSAGSNDCKHNKFVTYLAAAV
jgi:hypothetical protein